MPTFEIIFVILPT